MSLMSAQLVFEWMAINTPRMCGEILDQPQSVARQTGRNYRQDMCRTPTKRGPEGSYLPSKSARIYFSFTPGPWRWTLANSRGCNCYPLGACEGNHFLVIDNQCTVNACLFMAISLVWLTVSADLTLTSVSRPLDQSKATRGFVYSFAYPSIGRSPVPCVDWALPNLELDG